MVSNRKLSRRFISTSGSRAHVTTTNQGDYSA